MAVSSSACQADSPNVIGIHGLLEQFSDDQMRADKNNASSWLFGWVILHFLGDGRSMGSPLTLILGICCSDYWRLSGVSPQPLPSSMSSFAVGAFGGHLGFTNVIIKFIMRSCMSMFMMVMFRVCLSPPAQPYFWPPQPVDLGGLLSKLVGFWG